MRKDIFTVTGLLIFLLWTGAWLQGSVNAFAGFLTEETIYLQNIQQMTKIIFMALILYLSLYLVRSYRTYFLFKIAPFLLLTYNVSMNNFEVFNLFYDAFVIDMFWRITISIILIALYIEYQRTYLAIYPHFSINIFYDNLVDIIFVLSILYVPFLMQSNQLYFLTRPIFEIENPYLFAFNLLYFLPLALILLAIPIVVDAKPFYGTYLFKLIIVLFLYLGNYIQMNISSNIRNFDDIFPVYNYFLWIIVLITAFQLYRTTQYENTDH